MLRTASNRRGVFTGLLAILFAAAIFSTAPAIPSFESPDWRLPNPDRPYEMTSGTVSYEETQFSLYDLKFQAANPAQLDNPTFREDGRLAFDSTFDITYQAVISWGLEPPHSISGTGKARAVGITRPGPNPPHTFPHPQVFDTELLDFTLFGLSPIPEAMIRESPTLQSTGVIIRADPCPMCARPFTHWDISSYFDIYTEVTSSGGRWSPAVEAIHVEQAPDGLPPGDYNKDRVVDAGDYVVWRRTLGELGAGLPADGDWSGGVDAGDYAVWRANFGKLVSAHSTAAFVATAAPEPSTGFLLACGFLWTVFSSRRGPRAGHST